MFHLSILPDRKIDDRGGELGAVVLWGFRMKNVFVGMTLALQTRADSSSALTPFTSMCTHSCELSKVGGRWLSHGNAACSDGGVVIV